MRTSGNGRLFERWGFGPATFGPVARPRGRNRMAIRYITCPRCNGTGWFTRFPDRCNECVGAGRVDEDRYHPRHYTTLKSDDPR